MMQEWNIYVEGKFKGVVEAEDEMDAINMAYETWHIVPDMNVRAEVKEEE